MTKEAAEVTEPTEEPAAEPDTESEAPAEQEPTEDVTPPAGRLARRNWFRNS